MNTTTTSSKSILAQLPAVAAVRSSAHPSAKALASGMLAAAVAASVVLADHFIDDWAETHMLAAWLALWAVAIVAIVALRGVTRLLAHKLMLGLDAWSAKLARRRADQRLWAMAQTDSRLMQDLQSAIDRDEAHPAPVTDLTTFMTRRVARMVNNRLYYI